MNKRFWKLYLHGACLGLFIAMLRNCGPVNQGYNAFVYAFVFGFVVVFSVLIVHDVRMLNRP